MKNTITLIAAALAMTGCATAPMGAQYRPMVDRPGPTFESDLAECQAHAQRAISEANAAAAGAVATALLGAFLAPRGFRNEVAGKAAVLGGLGGAAQAVETRENIIKRCLSGRGHSVLN